MNQETESKTSQLDNSKVTKFQQEEILLDLQREEGKEEEYDYFMQSKEQDENQDGGA